MQVPDSVHSAVQLSLELLSDLPFWGKYKIKQLNNTPELGLGNTQDDNNIGGLYRGLSTYLRLDPPVAAPAAALEEVKATEGR